LIVAVSVLAADHVAKLGAAWLEPSAYTNNPAPMVYDGAPLVPIVALLIPSRVTAVLLGLFLGGGASNVADVYLWPGGVPDFIPVGDWVANPADFAIFGGVSALMAWPVWKLFQIARRQYPERPGRAEEGGHGRERFSTPTFRQEAFAHEQREGSAAPIARRDDRGLNRLTDPSDKGCRSPVVSPRPPLPVPTPTDCG
jgi:hypothetical protein